MAFVYALRSGESNRFKVGRTIKTLSDRIKELMTGNPDVLTAFDFIETDYEESKVGETYLKKRLRSKRRIEGGREWYELTPKDIAQAFEAARCHIETFRPLQDEVDRLSQSDTEDREVIPGERERELHRRLLEIREEEDMLRIERMQVENELKVTIGTAEALTGLATWKCIDTVRLDQERLRKDHPDLVVEYSTRAHERRFCII